MNKKVSVIIPCYSKEMIEDIKEAINSVKIQTYPPYEIIVAIDHNEELKKELDTIDSIKVVLNTKKFGSTETRNTGIRIAEGEIIAFIDDDAIADKNWLSNLIRHYDNSSVMAVGGKLISIWKNGRPFWFPRELDWLIGGTYKGHPQYTCEVRNLIWANMSFKKELCEQIGYIRTDMGAIGKKARAGDEVEYCLRMKHYNPDQKIIYEPRAIVFHKVLQHKSTFIHLISCSFNHGISKGISRKILKLYSKNTLSTENNYLQYLLHRSILMRLKRLNHKNSLFQLSSIITSLVMFGTGYLCGILKRSI